MLSHQHSTLDQQRQSRQQGPRLAMFENTQISQHPSTAPLRQRASFAPLPLGPQDDCMVGITNPGQLQQHYLQVAQQQRQALPGQTQPQNYAVPFTAEQYRMLQHRKLDAELDSAFQGNQMSPQHISSSAPAYQGLGISTIMPDSAVGMPGFGYLNPMTTMSPRRPITPPMQATTNFFPATPEATPFSRVIDFSPIRAPMELPKQSIDARRESDAQQASSGLQIIVTEPGRDSPRNGVDVKINPNLKTELLPSPPNTALIPSGRTFDASFIPGPPLHSLPALKYGAVQDASHFDLFNELVESSPMGSPQMSSAAQSPQHMSIMPPVEMSLAMNPVLDLSHSYGFFNASEGANFGPWDASRPDGSSRSGSLGELGLDAIVEDTGISAEEVQAFIEEPDLTRGGKWKCLFPGCDKLFGRKENIRSHVQTHLGDRQFKCIHCNKCFVRQHDLKRHSKIHSGVKPYPCRCGNTFARHDALTRHRQRGICDGGLPGIVKKTVKRGRPRKERLNTEERADKAARTRARNAENPDSYASSESDGSEGSSPSSQSSPLMFDNLDMSPLHQDNLVAFDMQQTSFAPSAFSNTPPTSPYSTGDKPSSHRPSVSEAAPSPHSVTLTDSHDSGVDADSKDMVLFQLSTHENHIMDNTPELSHSSPPSSSRLQDIDFGSAFSTSELGETSNSLDFIDQPTASAMSMFDMELLENAAHDPSWDSTYLDLDNNDIKSFQMFGDEAIFAESP